MARLGTIMINRKKKNRIMIKLDLICQYQYPLKISDNAL